PSVKGCFLCVFASRRPTAQRRKGPQRRKRRHCTKPHQFPSSSKEEFMNTREALRRIRLIYYSSMLLAVIVLSSSPAVAQTCEKLAELKLANTTITAAQPVAPGAFTTPGSTAAYKDLSSFCRV